MLRTAPLWSRRLAVSLRLPDWGLVCVRAWSYLRFVIQQARNPRWAAAGSGAHARNVPAVRSSHQKFWPRCSSPGCGRPVPPDALHDVCGRAGPYVALIRAPRHGGPCCPGACPGCRACLDTPRVQAGWCVQCGICVVCCLGHGVLALPTSRNGGRVLGQPQLSVNPRRHGHRRVQGKLRGKQPELPKSAQRSILRRYALGEVSLADLAEGTVGDQVHTARSTTPGLDSCHGGRNTNGGPMTGDLNLEGAARRLGLRVRQLRRVFRGGNFPDPAGMDAGEPYWQEADVLRWAADSDPTLAARIPLLYWPDATSPAKYLGARADGQDAFLGWKTSQGTVSIVWRALDPIMLSLPDLVRRVDGVTVLVNVEPDFGIDGPGVKAVNQDAPDDPYGLRWSDLSRVLGQPVPYWPLSLRITELICAWKPGAEQVIAPARSDLDTGALLRLAAVFDDKHPAHCTLLNLARVVQTQITTSAQRDLDIFREAITRGSHLEETTAIAAMPMSVPNADREDIDTAVRRAGWLAVLSRCDTLSVQCVREALAWDGGKDIPFCDPEQVDPTQGPGAEWIKRLEPIERTAAFELIDYNGGGQTLTDPATDAPAVLRTDGALVAAIPQRLPATSPLAELILSEDLVWIRTADGTLYPAPKDASLGLSWGYSGGGSAELAALIGRLLDDINAIASGNYCTSDGLEQLTQMPWPAGTVLTREQLEAARAGHPPQPPSR
jgi:hypothetical protein